jgi:hypothetical protein
MGSTTLRFQKWQRNHIFETIQTAGLDPQDFDLHDQDAEIQIKHKLSVSCFTIGGDAGHYVGHYVVGDAPDWPIDVYSWQALIQRISYWLNEVKRDLESPDLWAALGLDSTLLGGNSDDGMENILFTLDEQKEIAQRLRELGEQTRRAYSLSETQARVLNAKIDYLVGAAGRLGRIDWRNALVGAIISLVLIAALPPESARDILLKLLRPIGHFFGLPELPGS